METQLEKLLISPLEQVINFFKENKLDYSLVEIEPPHGNKNYSERKKVGIKRVLNIKKRNDSYKVYWSFQYYE